MLVKKSETVKLFRHIDPYFKRMLDKLYLREISHSEWNEIQKKTHTEQEVMESIASGTKDEVTKSSSITNPSSLPSIRAGFRAPLLHKVSFVGRLHQLLQPGQA